MKLKINFTPKGNDTFLSITSFIKSGWGERVAKKFVDKVYKTLATISQLHYIFKAYGETDIRKGFITKHTSVIYRVCNDRIEILFFWDNRQEPVNR